MSATQPNPSRWMMMPKGEDHSDAERLHYGDSWCAKAGCTPISEQCAQEILAKAKAGRTIRHNAAQPAKPGEVYRENISERSGVHSALMPESIPAQPAKPEP